jgi:hypothetical protein
MSASQETVTPFEDRVITDYATLDPDYVADLQRRMDETGNAKAKAEQARRTA